MRQDSTTCAPGQASMVGLNKALEAAKEYFAARRQQFSHVQFFEVGDGVIVINSTPDADEKSDWYLWYDTRKWRLNEVGMSPSAAGRCFPQHLEPYWLGEISECLLEMPPRTAREFVECVRGQELLLSIEGAKWLEQSREVPL